jgi:hypothetical protein
MADLFDARSVPLHTQLECVERELKMRKHVYPRRVATNVMTQQLADREIANMTAVVETIRGLVKAQERAAAVLVKDEEGAE